MSDSLSDEELLARFPGESVTRENAAHYRGRVEHQLVLNRCGECSSWHQPPQPVCPCCWSSELVPTAVSGHGTVFAVIFLYQGPPADGVDYRTPYPVVTVELEEQEGLRYTSTVVGAPNEDIRIGRRVELDWVERSGAPLPVFRLAAS